MSDNEATGLLLTISADIRSLERQMERASGIVSSHSRRMVQDASGIGGALSNVFNSGTSALVDTATSRLGVLGGAIGALGPLGIAAGAGLGVAFGAMQMLQESANWADDLMSVANALAMTAEQVQVLDEAARGAGIPVEQMHAAIQGLSAAMGAMQTGVGARRMAPVFDQLGITQEQLLHIRDVNDLLPLVANGLANLGTEAERVQVARRLGIEALLPLLRQGADHFNEVTGAVANMGVVVSDTAVGSLADLHTSMRVADERSAAASRTLQTSLIPMVNALKNALAGASVALANFINWMNHFDSAEYQGRQRVQQAVSARTRAAALRRGGIDAALSGAASGLDVLQGPARLEQLARREDARAAAIEAEIAIGRPAHSAGGGALPPAAVALPTPPTLGGSGRPARTPRAGGGGRSGPTPQELADMRELLGMEHALAVAREVGDAAQIQRLEDQMTRRRDIQAYMRAGLTLTEATVRADQNLSDIQFARQALDSREINNVRGLVTVEERRVELNRILNDLAEEQAYWAEQELQFKIGAAEAAGNTANAAATRREAERRRLAAEYETHGMSPEEAAQRASQVVNQQVEADTRQSVYTAVRGGVAAAIRDGWRGLAEYMANTLRERLMDRLADVITNLIMSASSGSSSGGGGILGTIVGAFTGGFGGGSGGFKIGKNALGTNNWRGGLSIVGENGPELLNIPRGSQIIPAGVLRNMAAVGTSSVVLNDFHLHAEGAIMTGELLAAFDRKIAVASRSTLAVGAAMQARNNKQRASRVLG